MTLEAIGQKLKSSREAQGLSLRQIYERTKIPINHLQALDVGNPDDLPEPVYVAGFIKRYAECIGLDGQMLADEYKRAETSNGNGNGKPKSPPQGQQVYVTPDYLKHAKMNTRAPSYKLWLFPLVIIVVLVAVLSWYSTQVNNTASQQGDGSPSLKEALSRMQQQGTPAPDAQSPAQASGATQGAGAPLSAAQFGDNKLILSADKHVWIEVKKLSSGESLYTGFLEPGDSRTFEEQQGLRIRAGNGGSLKVEFKGKIEPFGQNGKPTERTFTASEAAAVVKSDKPASASVTSTTASSAQSAPAIKPKKPVHKADSSTVHQLRNDDGGTRSIPGSDGMRSIDVPYRY